MDRALLGFVAAVALLMALGAAETNAGDHPWAAVVWTVALVALAEVCAWAAIRTGVSSDEYGVTTRKVRTIRIAWEDIDRIESDFAMTRWAGQFGWITERYAVAVLKDGNVVRLSIPRRRREVVDALAADLEAARAG